MAKKNTSLKENRSVTQKIHKDDVLEDYSIAVYGSFHGKIRDIDVNLITGDILQQNYSALATTNISVATTGGTTQVNNLDSLQINLIEVTGDAKLDFTINGQFKGQIRDIQVGLITGDVIQLNVSEQTAINLAVETLGLTEQTIVQTALQTNVLEVTGAVSVSFVMNGDFHGKLRDIEVGLITGDVVQANFSSQEAANIALETVGGMIQTVNQTALQQNSLEAIGNVHVTIVFGDFKGQFRDVTIGVITADIIQSNNQVAVGMNLSESSKGTQHISNFATQTSLLDVNGDMQVEININDGFKGNLRDIQIDLIIDNVFQMQSAAGDTVWA